MTENTVSVDDFFSGRGSPTGMARWLRDLEEMKPTRVPEVLSKASDLAHAVRSNARGAGVPVRVRHIRGEVWVLRLPKDGVK